MVHSAGKVQRPRGTLHGKALVGLGERRGTAQNTILASRAVPLPHRRPQIPEASTTEFRAALVDFSNELAALQVITSLPNVDEFRTERLPHPTVLYSFAASYLPLTLPTT